MWYGVDPLAEKYPSISAYAYVANNPIKYIDPDGNIIVDANGTKIYDQKTGWVKGAPVDAVRIGNALIMSRTGRESFKKLADADFNVTLNLVTGNGPVGRCTHHPDGSKTINIWEEQVKEAVANYADLKERASSGELSSYETILLRADETKKAEFEAQLTVEEMIGTVAVHETEHATNPEAQAKNVGKPKAENAANKAKITATEEIASDKQMKRLQSIYYF